VLHRPSYRRNAALLRDELERLPGPELAVALLERLARDRARSSPHTDSPFLPWLLARVGRRGRSGASRTPTGGVTFRVGGPLGEVGPSALIAGPASCELGGLCSCRDDYR
jgi:hypothetical protein